MGVRRGGLNACQPQCARLPNGRVTVTGFTRGILHRSDTRVVGVPRQGDVGRRDTGVAVGDAGEFVVLTVDEMLFLLLRIGALDLSSGTVVGIKGFDVIGRVFAGDASL